MNNRLMAMAVLKLAYLFRSRSIVSILTATLLAVACGGGSGGGSEGEKASTVDSNVVAVQGNLAVAVSDLASKYTVLNSNQSSIASSVGDFSTAVAKARQTYTYAISDTGKKVYAAVSTNADGSITINAQTTAEAMILLNPLLIPRASAERAKIINIVKADALVRYLATVIESVYSSVEDPMSDVRISNALTDAVKSVFTSWQESNVAPVNTPRQVIRKGVVLVQARSTPVSSSLQIINNDMGALTLANSTGPTLKLELNNVGILGVTTNVDWVVRIVELDSAKIQWTKKGGAQLINPTVIDIDNLIKPGGYDQKTIVEGAVGSGLLEFIVDPIGKLADSIYAEVFPDSGIRLPHDGVYAVIALSGSPFGDSAEFNSVKSSAWQRSLYAEAAGINMISAAIDVVGVGTTFASVAAGGVIPDISPLLALELGTIKTELTNNPDYVGSTAAAYTTAYFLGKVPDIVDKLLDYLRPYIHSSISDPQSFGLKKFLHVSASAALSAVGVWSGTVTTGTRVANYLFSVTPRESGYALLGAFPEQTGTTPPTVPSGLTAIVASANQINLSWSSNTESDLAGYEIYKGGVFLKSASTNSANDTGLTSSTQYCYTVRAYDAAGNRSAQSSQACATTLPTFGFTSPSLGTVSATTVGYQPTITASGNVTQVSFNWSGATSGSATWVKNDANWLSKVTTNLDGSITLRPVVTQASDLAGATDWTVTLRDSAGTTQAQTFTVNYQPATTAATAVVSFSDNFDRPDSSAVGNGWITSEGSKTDLQIKNNEVTGGSGGMYRPQPFNGPVTVSATLKEKNGYGGLLRQYGAALSILSDGDLGRGHGYGVLFSRSDQNYNNSTVALIDGLQEIIRIDSSVQYGPQIRVRVVFSLDGSVAGTVGDGVNTFNFSFGPRTIQSTGANFAYFTGAPDARSAVITYPRLDDVVVSTTVAASVP